MDIVLAGARTHQLKEFTKMQWISSIDLDTPRDKDHQSIGIMGGLNVHALDGVMDLSHTLQLVEDILCPLELLALECQHGRRCL